jgi:hypothetical protein
LDSPTQMEEERRLMYVGVTRAADLLYITLSRKRMLMQRGAGSSFSSSYTIPSRFLKEITPGLVAGYYPSETPAPSEYGAQGEFGRSGNYGNITGGSGRNGGYRQESYRGEDPTYDGGGSKYGDDSYGNSGNSGYGGNANRGGSGNNSSFGNRGGGQYNGGSGSSSGYQNRGGSSGGYNNRGSSPSSGGYGSTSGSNSPAHSKYNAPNPAAGRPASGERPRAMRPGESTNDPRYASSNPREQDANRPPGPAEVFEKLAIGDSVQHIKFGTGRVVQIIGDKGKELYNVEFEGGAGKRLLDPKFAKLIKL